MKRNLIILFTFLLLVISCYSGTNTATTSSSSGKNTLLENQKQMAIASVLRGNFKQALKDVEKAKEIDEDDPGVYLVYGIIYYGLKDYKQAENYYKKALEKDKDFSEARYNLCGLYLKMGRYDDAIEQCSIVASDLLYEGRVGAYTNIGAAYLRKGNVNKAKEYLDKALEINPAYVYAHNELGKLYLAIGDIKKAIGEFKIAIEGFPQYAEAYYNLALAYLTKGDRFSACQTFKKVVEVSPGTKLAIEAKRRMNTACSSGG